MTVVVAAASANSPEFAVIDFTTVPPSHVMVGASSVGNVVDCYGTLVAVGDCASGMIALYDVTYPGSPARRGSIDIGVTGVRAISIDDAYVLAAGPGSAPEAPLQIVLISIADPANPSIVSVYQRTSFNAVYGVTIRGANAIVCGTDAFFVIDYSDPAHPTGVIVTGPPGPVMGDFDGTNAAFASIQTSPTAQSQDISIYGIADGGYTALKTIDNGSSLSSLAIAEIPEGGQYVAMGLGSQFVIQYYPSEMQSGFFSGPQLKPYGQQWPVAVRFLNNPAIAPYLAVANLAAEQGFFVTCNFLFLESDGINATIHLGAPIPLAQVALASTDNPTLGITAFEPPALPPWHIPWLPWPLPPWLRQRLGIG